MKSRILLISIFLSVCFSGSVSAQTSSEAINYMQDLFGFYEDLNVETWQYLKAVTRGRGARKVENRRRDLMEEIRAGRFRHDLYHRLSVLGIQVPALRREWVRARAWLYRELYQEEP